MLKVLVVEDDEGVEFVRMKKRIWYKCGFQISQEISKGIEALSILEKESFALIFMNINMAYENGVNILQELKNRNINTPVILSSELNNFENTGETLVSHAYDYVLKPINGKILQHVLNRVKEYIKISESTDEIQVPIIEVYEKIGVSIKSNKFVYDTAKYFSDNFGKEIIMQNMADEFGFSKDYFGKIFKKNLGVGLNHFSTLIKIAYAKELIVKGDYKTYEISRLVGYSSIDYFTKIFKDVTGETPSTYKETLEKKFIKDKSI